MKAGPAQPAIAAAEALRMVLDRDGHRVVLPANIGYDPQGDRWIFDGASFAGEEPFAELVWLAAGESLSLAWNVNYYQVGGAHWWNVRIDARSGTGTGPQRLDGVRVRPRGPCCR